MSAEDEMRSGCGWILAAAVALLMLIVGIVFTILEVA